MSDNEYDASDWQTAPSWERVTHNCLLILESAADPEDALNFALTRQELAFLCAATEIQVRLFPELGQTGLAFLQKVAQLAEAQEYLEVTPELKRELGIE